MSVLFYYSFLSLHPVSPFFRFVFVMFVFSLSGTVTVTSSPLILDDNRHIPSNLHFYCTVLSHYSILETQKNPQVARYVGGNNTRIQTQRAETKDPKSTLQQQHAVCVWSSPTCVMDGALQLKVDNDVDDTSILSSSNSVGSGSGCGSGELLDMCCSDRDARHTVSVYTRMVQLY
mmetsp:Transcript_57797/g.62438  ORF Transcript_57797/g.62438 Transcript_57797/m.62438 type:complete len:175 (+) Transcript_57797:337-861(+)